MSSENIWAKQFADDTEQIPNKCEYYTAEAIDIEIRNIFLYLKMHFCHSTNF